MIRNRSVYSDRGIIDDRVSWTIGVSYRRLLLVGEADEDKCSAFERRNDRVDRKKVCKLSRVVRAYLDRLTLMMRKS